MTKLTRAQKVAMFMQHMQEESPDTIIAQDLYDTVELLKKAVAEIAPCKPIPAQVQVMAVMQRALAELDALQQQYYPDEDEPEEQEAA